MSEKNIIFFIGTIAEYIKLFTVIETAKELGLPYKIILSGQNEIVNTDIAKATSLVPDLQLSLEKNIIKNVFGLFGWFFKTLFSSKKVISNTFSDVDFKNSVFVVHGDTLSTVMGAVLAKRLHSKLCHVEAGLRSHHWFSPFPEEIDRHIVSKLSDYNFCQGNESFENLKKYPGERINTEYNTIIDSLFYSDKQQIQNKKIAEIIKTNYCVCVVHRQENLLKTNFVKHITKKIIDVSKREKVVFILHTITKNTLMQLNLLNKLQESENIILLDRAEYFDFMKLLQNSDFVITDGGSNQEELYYMGKPTLILRSATERQEGIGENALLYGDDLSSIDLFIKNYKTFEREPITPNVLPSKIICNKLMELIDYSEDKQCVTL